MVAMMWTSGLLAILATAAFAANDGRNNCILRSRDLCQPTHQELKDAFTQFMIVPQIISASPRSLLTIYFNHYTVCLGNRIPPWETTMAAFISWPNPNLNSLHTLVVIDPDNPQFFSTTLQYVIQLMVNVPGVNFAAAVNLTPRKPFAPLPGTNDHRYICLVFKQHTAINVTSDLLYRYSRDFYNFTIADFIEEYNLGIPVAGNFFVSRQDLCDLPEEEEKEKQCVAKETKKNCECKPGKVKNDL